MQKLIKGEEFYVVHWCDVNGFRIDKCRLRSCTPKIDFRHDAGASDVLVNYLFQIILPSHTGKTFAISDPSMIFETLLEAEDRMGEDVAYGKSVLYELKTKD